MWIFDNPLGNMPGPDFLALYGLVILTVWIVTYARRMGLDQTNRDEPIPIIQTPNPYEIAILRGGVNELARTLIAALVDRRAVEILPSKSHREPYTLQRKAGGESPQAFDALTSKALVYFDRPRHPAGIFEPGGLCGHIAADAALIEARLRDQGMLSNHQMRHRAARFVLQGMIVITALGAYKLVAALHHGRHNVTFLILMGLMSNLLLIPIGRVPRVTRRGLAHLERLRTAFATLKYHRDEEDLAMRTSTVTLATAIFGITAMGGLAGAEMTRAFRRAARHDESSSCGAVHGCGSSVHTTTGCGSTTTTSCGSSCSGGGGSGCGGCGGGGGD